MILSVCMIIKNEEKNLEKSLPNLSKLADEIIFVDTGSTDKSREIAKEYGAKVFDFKWVNDFSAARNYSLEQALGDFIMWVDADEIIKEEDFSKIKELLYDKEAIAFMLRVCECHEGDFNPASFNLRPKLFRNKIGLRFDRPINEQLYTKDGKVAANLAKKTDIPIYHFGGFLPKEESNKKRERNIPLLEKAIKEKPNDPAFRFLLANNYKEIGRREEALLEFDNIIKMFPKDPFALEAMVEKMWILYKEKKVKVAYGIAKEILKIDQNNIAAWNMFGFALLALKEYEKAIKLILDAQALPVEDSSITVNLGQKEYISNLILSRAYLETGKQKEAYECAEYAYEFNPTQEAKAAMEAAKWE